jgi:hypothetical protein
MLILALFRLVSSAAGMMMPWLLNLATRMLARFLNMPEPLVHDTGILLFTHAQTIESSVGNTLCPIRLLRQLRSLLKTLSRPLLHCWRRPKAR